MRTVAVDAVVGLDHRDEILLQDALEGTGEVHAGEGVAALRTLALGRSLRARCTGGRTLRTRVVGAVGVGTIIHHDDERDGLAGGDEVVHDDAGTALLRPAVLIFAAAVLQVEHRVFLVRILFVLGRGVDVAVAHRAGHGRVVVHLADLALGNVLQGVEVLVRRGDVDAAAPAGGAVVIEAARIRHGGAVDFKLIVVEAFVLRGGVAGPEAGAVVDHVVLHAADVQLDALGIRGLDLGADHALGVDHRVLVVRLVGGGGLEIFLHLRGQAERREESNQGKSKFLHTWCISWFELAE